MLILDKTTLKILSSTNCSFCEKCFAKELEKAKRHYSSIVLGDKMIVYTCPYGYCSIVGEHRIYTGLKIKGYYVKKKTESKARDCADDSTIFNEKDLFQMINRLENLESESASLKTYTATIHDIKRATSCFTDLLEEVIEDGEYKNDKNLRDLIDGLDLIRTRLDYHDFLLNKNQDVALSRTKLNLINIGVKISKMLKYKSDMKQLKISNTNFAPQQLITVADSKRIFVLFFILVENAIKYSPQGESIYIDYDLSADNYVTVSFKK